MDEKYWTTKNGDDILYKDLTDSHLLNILSFIEKTAEKGLVVGGGGWDIDDMWYDEIYGEEVFTMLDFYGLIEEANKRYLFDK